MSNALSACVMSVAAAAGSDGPWGRLLAAGTDEVAPSQFTLLAVGTVLLVVWILRRAVHPKNLRLVRSPGRGNTLAPLHLVALLVVWLGVTIGAQELLSRTVAWAGPPCLVENTELDMRTALLAGVTGQVLWLLASLLVARRNFPLGLSRGLGLSMRHWFYDGARSIVATLAVFPVCIGLSALSILLLEPYGLVHEHTMLTALKALGPAWQVMTVLSAVVLAPLAEEIFFRGLVQSMLRRYTGQPWVAVVATSAAFAAIHFSTPQHMPALFALSLVLGYNYERTGRLVSAISIHMLFNAISITETLMASG